MNGYEFVRFIWQRKIDWECLEELSRKDLKALCKRINEKEWRRDLKCKSSLKFYKKMKKRMGMSTSWNERKSRRLRLYESGSVLTKSKMGGTESEKACERCGVEENLEHLVKDCLEMKR